MKQYFKIPDISKKEMLRSGIRLGLGFGLDERLVFCKRLALYLRSGIPITRAIGFLAEDTNAAASVYVFAHIEEVLAQGLPLSHALAEFPKQFDSFTIGFIRTGEASGTLAETLERLAMILSKRAALQQKILSALAYPAIIMCGTIAVALFLTLFIFPKILPVLQAFHTKLPLSTRILIGIDTVCTHDWLGLLVVCGACAGALAFFMRKKRVQHAIECIFLQLPLFSLLFRYYALATFARTLSVQLKGGIRILPALSLVRTALPGTIYPGAVQSIEYDISQGLRLSVALKGTHDAKKFSGKISGTLFPPLVRQMVAAGEMTGTLSANLEAVADLYENYLDDLTKNLTVLVEPVLMVCMGCVVGFVALAIITPIYQVTQSIPISPS